MQEAEWHDARTAAQGAGRQVALMDSRFGPSGVL